MSGAGMSVFGRGSFAIAIAGGLGADSILGGSGTAFGAAGAILSSDFDSGLATGSTF